MKKTSIINLLLLFFLLNGASLFGQTDGGTKPTDAHVRFCAMLEKACLSRYDTAVVKLRQRLDQQQISRQDFGSSMEKVAISLNQAFQNIDAFADQLAELQQDSKGGDFDIVMNNFIVLNVMPLSDSESQTASDGSDDFDFLFKGLNFVDACTYFGDYYLDQDMKDLAVYYYTMALDMYEVLNGYEDSDFTDQIKKLQSTIKKIQK